MLVISYQTPVQYQDPAGLLDPPPIRLRSESRLLRVAYDGLDIDAQPDSMSDDLVLEALVDQSLLDGAAGVHGDLVQQGDARGVVVRTRGEDGDGDDQAEHVHGQSPLAARHPLCGSRPVVEAAPRGTSGQMDSDLGFCGSENTTVTFRPLRAGPPGLSPGLRRGCTL